MYSESKKILDKIFHENEILFRMAVSHLLDVGIRNLTEENVEATCAEMMLEDDSHSFMSNRMKCDIVRTAAKLAAVDHIHLLVYIQREIAYDVGDGICLPNLPTCFGNYLEMITWQTESDAIFKDLQIAGLTKAEINWLGFGYCIPEDDMEDD